MSRCRGSGEWGFGGLAGLAPINTTATVDGQNPALPIIRNIP